MECWNDDLSCITPPLHYSITPLTAYGFDQKTPQGENQQAQTAQEAAPASSQEAHLAEVSFAARPFVVLPRRRRDLSSAVRGLLYRMSCCPYLSLAALALSAWLAAGCRTSPAQGPGPDAKPAASAGEARGGKRAEANHLNQRAKAHAHYAAGVVHDLNDEHDLALEEFYQAARACPDDEELILEVSRRCIQNKQPEKALELLLTATAQPRASGELFARLGLVYAQLGQNEKAIEANRMALKRTPHSLAACRNLFLGYLQAKQPEAALKVLEEAAGPPEAEPEFLIGIAELYATYALQFPRQREAIHAKGLAVLGRVKDSELLAPQLRLKLADGFYLFGDAEKATPIYLDVLKHAGDFPLLRDNVRVKLANIYLRSSDRKRAVEQLEAIVREDPSNAQAYYFLGTIATEENRWADAVENLKKTILFNPDFEPAHYDLAAAQTALGNTGDALATLDRARARFSTSLVLEYLLGMAHNQQKDYAEAANHFTAAEVIAQATETNRLTDHFYFQLGATFERKGDRAQAARYFEKCLQLSPDFAEALNYLGYMWAEHGEHLEQARAMIERALKAEPKSAAYLDSMGWVLYKLDQPKEALDYLLQAVAASEQPDATIYDHLGDIYAALKETEKAREAWRKSLSVEKNDAVQKKLDAAKTD
jgi:tetratricopeptide (TPR) repeat protein